jgi:hypothetical protein
MLPELYFLDIKQMVSTWLEPLGLMSTHHAAWQYISIVFKVPD